MDQQQNKDKEKQLSDTYIALFLLMLKYNNDKEFKKLLLMYKQHREELKDYIGKAYLRYIKDNKLIMNYKDINKEINRLGNKLKIIGNDLRNEEDIVLKNILYKVYNDSYYKSINIIGKYKSGNALNVSKLTNKIINKTIDSKIDGKSNTQRNKANKEKFINRIKNHIKNNFKSGKSIEVFNETIDKDFNSSANDSDRLVDNEVDIIYNAALMQSYKDANIRKVMWISQLEQNTCSECSSMDTEVFDIEEAPCPVLDTHVNCKCILIPIIN